jgi:hypothetical protein
VAGANAFTNATAVSRNPAIKNGQEYTSVVQVRKHSIKAWLDGEMLRFWPTDYKDLGMRKDWKLRNNGVLGLGAHNSKVTFTRVQLREVTGKGKPK